MTNTNSTDERSGIAIWQALLAAHAAVTERLDEDLGEQADMGLAEFEVLDHLARAEDLTVRMNELAALVRLSPSGLTRRFDSLVRRGLVVREPCDDDRRGINARLTPEGLRRHASAVRVHSEGVHKYVVEHLDERDTECLTRSLEALASAASRSPAPAPGVAQPR
ncbi:MAG: MarR family transcriptional regulator [Microthrixaceae bacterium]|nr:MarR family transcriptional regulator [Microthrixaceae bacterium]